MEAGELQKIELKLYLIRGRKRFRFIDGECSAETAMSEAERYRRPET